MSEEDKVEATVTSSDFTDRTLNCKVSLPVFHVNLFEEKCLMICFVICLL